MATSYQAFNSMLSEFFGDLADTFDEYKSISTAKKMLDVYLASNSDTDVPLKEFVRVFTPHKELLMQKDEKLFDECKLPYVSDSGFDIAKEWGTLEEDNKDAIWDYLHQLFRIGSALSNMGDDVISQIEGVAHGFLDKVKNKELTQEQVQDPMFIAKEIMGNKDLMTAISSIGDNGDFNPMDMMNQLMGDPEMMNQMMGSSGLMDTLKTSGLGEDGGNPMDMITQLMNNPDLKKAFGEK